MVMRTINYSPKPSPLHSPPVPLSVLDGDHHMRLHLAPIILIVITGTTCIVMFLFLFTLFKILRHHRYRYNFTRSNQPILFDIRRDFPFSDDEEHGEAAAIRPQPMWFIATAAATATATATEEGLQQSIIDSITVCEYRKDDEGTLVKETECLVCLGEFQQEESLRVLPKCNHAFHVPCIDTWLRSHKSCPLCRAAIVLDVVASVEFDSSVSDMNELYIEESRESGGVTVVGDEEDDDSSVTIYPSFQDK